MWVDDLCVRQSEIRFSGTLGLSLGDAVKWVPRVSSSAGVAACATTTGLGGVGAVRLTSFQPGGGAGATTEAPSVASTPLSVLSGGSSTALVTFRCGYRACDHACIVPFVCLPVMRRCFRTSLEPL